MFLSELQRSIEKQPSEERVVLLDFSDVIANYFGVINSAGLTATKWHKLTPQNVASGDEILTANQGDINPPYLNKVVVHLQGGDIDFDYHVTCKAETAEGERLEKDFYVKVRER